MHVPGTASPQWATFDDVRSLLDALNAVHLAERTERPRTLALGVAGLVGADAAAVFVADPGAPPAWLGGSTGLPPPAFVAAGVSTELPDGVTRLAAGSTPPCAPAVLRSVHRRGEGLSVLAAWRPSPFDEREERLLGMFHPAVAWAVANDAWRSGLSAGADAVLELMLMGLPEKTIARRLGRSTHTVHSHVKRVYRHYRVSSRPELMARFFEKRPE